MAPLTLRGCVACPGRSPVVSVSGSGNVVPLTIIDPDIFAGKVRCSPPPPPASQTGNTLFRLLAASGPGEFSVGAPRHGHRARRSCVAPLSPSPRRPAPHARMPSRRRLLRPPAVHHAHHQRPHPDEHAALAGLQPLAGARAAAAALGHRRHAAAVRRGAAKDAAHAAALVVRRLAGLVLQLDALGCAVCFLTLAMHLTPWRAPAQPPGSLAPSLFSPRWRVTGLVGQCPNDNPPAWAALHAALPQAPPLAASWRAWWAAWRCWVPPAPFSCTGTARSRRGCGAPRAPLTASTAAAAAAAAHLTA